MKLPSMIKGWLNSKASPEFLLSKYYETGNNRYLSLLVTEFNAPIFHYLLSLSNQNLAEDALQSTWLKVIKANTKTPPINVKSWLYTIARNTLIDELRRQKKWHYQMLSDEQLSSLSLEKDAEKESDLVVFNKALAKLPFYQKEAFIFQHEGFSVLEICQLVDEDFETVKSRVRYARNNMKKMLTKQYLGKES